MRRSNKHHISDAEMREFDKDCLAHKPEPVYEAKKSMKIT